MNTKLLFRIAAAFNLLVGLPMLVAWPQFAAATGMDGARSIWTDIVAATVTMFGWVYWRIASDPVKYRPYVVLGIVGKLAFAAIIYAHWLAGTAVDSMALLVTADVAFAALFVAWLRGHPAAD